MSSSSQSRLIVLVLIGAAIAVAVSRRAAGAVAPGQFAVAPGETNTLPKFVGGGLPSFDLSDFEFSPASFSSQPIAGADPGLGGSSLVSLGKGIKNVVDFGRTLLSASPAPASFSFPAFTGLGPAISEVLAGTASFVIPAAPLLAAATPAALSSSLVASLTSLAAPAAALPGLGGGAAVAAGAGAAAGTATATAGAFSAAALGAAALPVALFATAVLSQRASHAKEAASFAPVAAQAFNATALTLGGHTGLPFTGHDGKIYLAPLSLKNGYKSGSDGIRGLWETWDPRRRELGYYYMGHFTAYIDDEHDKFPRRFQRGGGEGGEYGGTPDFSFAQWQKLPADLRNEEHSNPGLLVDYLNAQFRAGTAAKFTRDGFQQSLLQGQDNSP